MKRTLKWGIVIGLILLAAGCNAETHTKPAKTVITIEPYVLNKKEKELISKTGTDNIEFFKLNGTLENGDDLQYTIALYEKGKFKENMLGSSGGTEKTFQDVIISFGTSAAGTENSSIKLLQGVPSGLNTAELQHKVSGWTFSSLLQEKITLQKNKPVYLAGWSGTTTNSLRSFSGKNGKPPERLKETEIVLLYKVEWTDKQQIGRNE